MRTQLELHNELLDILPNCYFQPPESVKLVYPCIVYQFDRLDADYSDDILYRTHKRYTLTLIDKNPNSVYFEPILNKFMYISHDRRYVADNLVHDAFVLYY